MRSMLAALLCLLIPGCGQSSGPSCETVLIDTPEGTIRCSFFANRGKITCAVYVRNPQEVLAVDSWDSVISEDGRVSLVIQSNDESGNETEFCFFEHLPGSKKAKTFGFQPHDLHQGEVFLLGSNDHSVTTMQVDYFFEDTGCSSEELSEYGKEIVTELAVKNEAIREFLEQKQAEDTQQQN